MDSLDDHHYSLNRFLLSCIGLWPYEKTWLTYVKRVFYLLIEGSALMVQIRTLLICEVLSINILFDTLTNMTFVMIGLLKHGLYLWKLKGVKQLLEMIRENWKQTNDEYEMRILLRNADDGKYMAMILSVGIHVMIMSYVVFATTMNNVSNSTSTEDYMVYSRVKLMYTKNDEEYYLASLMHTYLVVLLVLMALAGTEATTILCDYHAFGMLQILCHRARNAFNDAVDPKKERATIAKFSYAIVRFRRLLQILPTAAVIVEHFLYIGLANHLGQMAIDNGAKFFSDTYNGLWYRASLPAQKLLLFIMCHGRKDIVFVFGGIFCPCYEGFTTMTKLSVSYLMVMYSLDL